MNPTHSAVISLPTHREDPFDPPPAYARLREQSPVCPLRLADGKDGWLLTRHEDVRAMLADDRFSANRIGASLPLQQIRLRPEDRAGSLLNMDPPEHTQVRRLLTGYFTVRRMRALEPRVAQIVDEHIDAMLKTGPPSDLVSSFALPIPSLVICELLGVPYADRADFQRWGATVLTIGAPEDEVNAARDAMREYMRGLAESKREQPDDGLISALIWRRDDTDNGGDSGSGSSNGRQGPAADLDPEVLAGLGLLLLIAGHETTANMLALGTYTLLSHPEQLADLKQRPEIIDHAVEELLRYLSIIHFGLARVAKQDLEIGGRTIKAGQTVVASIPAANRDPEHFADPDALDLDREPAQHVSFGHGVHQCLGQQLARVEMRLALPRLFERLPNLRLAVPPEQIPLREDRFIYGLHCLPLMWDA